MDKFLQLLPIVVTIIAGAIAYWRYMVERGYKQDALMNTLFGELGCILEHYTYAAHELSGTTKAELSKRLAWSKYGLCHFSDDVSRYGFLDASEIQTLLQLGLKIRNNDHLCEAYLTQVQDSDSLVSDEELNVLRGRMIYIMNSSSELLNSLVIKEPRLKQTLNAIVSELPVVGQLAKFV